MALLITNYLLFDKVLKKLDLSFETSRRMKTQNGDLMFKTKKAFLYANINSISLVENKHNLVDIDYKLFKNKYIADKNFDHDMILMNIGIISSTILKECTLDYFSNLKGFDKLTFSRDIDILMGKSNGIDLDKGLNKVFDIDLNIVFKELDYIKFLLNDQQFFPLGDVHFENNINTLKRLFRKKRFFKNNNLKEYLYHSKCSMSDEFINSKVYNNTKSFNDIFNEAFDKAFKEIDKYLKGLLL